MLDTFIGRVDGVEECDAAGAARGVRLPQQPPGAARRSSRTASPTPCAPRASATAPHRIGVFVGTSTSGILQTELAYRAATRPPARCRARLRLPAHAQHALGGRLRARRFGLRGPARAVSHRLLVEREGCSRCGARMIEAGLIDAAVVGGVDTLCLTTLYGFNSLELLSARAVPSVRRRARRHLDRRRRRRSRCSSARRARAVALLGVGES